MNQIRVCVLAAICTCAAFAGHAWAEGERTVSPFIQAIRAQIETDIRRFQEAAEEEGRRPKSYYKCLLEHLDGAKNDGFAKGVVELCGNEHPSHKTAQDQKEGGWFSRTSAVECFQKYGEKTSSPIALRYINSSCNRLHGS